MQASVDCNPSIYSVSNAKRIVVVTHGFNNLPSELDSIIRDLTQNHMIVVQVCLKGHGLNDPEMKTVTSEDWKNNVLEAIEIAAQISRVYEKERLGGLPISYLGFSLGALTYEVLETEGKTNLIDKKVFLSPAFFPKFEFVTPMYEIGNKLWLPSFTPTEYRANRRTRFAAFKSMYDLSDEFEKRKLNDKSTLVFINPKDELLKLNEMKTMFEEQKLKNWNVIEVSKSNDAKHYLNHLIVDEKSLGSESYQKMSAEIIKYFLN